MKIETDNFLFLAVGDEYNSESSADDYSTGRDTSNLLQENVYGDATTEIKSAAIEI